MQNKTFISKGAVVNHYENDSQMILGTMVVPAQTKGIDSKKKVSFKLNYSLKEITLTKS